MYMEEMKQRKIHFTETKPYNQKLLKFKYLNR